jgi:phage terminase large subunit
MSAGDVAIETIRSWNTIPGKFEWDNFGVELDAWAIEATKALLDPSKPRSRIALRACVGPGKTAFLAMKGWQFLACRGLRGEHPKGAAVSITGDNLRDNLWSELAKWQERSNYLRAMFTWTKKRIFAKQHPETWFLGARSWSAKSDPETQGRTLSGLHSMFPFVLADETGEMPPAVLKAAEQALSKCQRGMILQAGNPTSLDGLLFQAATQLAHLWINIPISGDPDDPLRSPRVDADWAREQIETYGRDNPWVMSNILGKFPPSSLNTMLGPEDVELSMARHVPEDMIAFAQRRLGIDLARFGDDSTVLTPRQGLVMFQSVKMKNAVTEAIVGRVALAQERWRQEINFLDSTGGWGVGVEDGLRLAHFNVYPVNFSSKADEPKFFNKRSEILWRTCEWVKKGGCLYASQQLKRELLTLKYWYEGSKFRVVEKDQQKKLLGGISPDEQDSLATTFALPDMPASIMPDGTVLPGAGVGKAETERPE